MRRKTAIFKPAAVTAMLFLFYFNSFSQNKIYAYYLNDKMEFVPREQASIIGKGSKRDTGFMVQFYTLADNRLILVETFKDSTLSILDGPHVAYHPNRKKSESAYYKNNVLHGLSLKWDSLSRITDSAMYYEGMPTYLVRYQVNADGNSEKLYEFDHTAAKRRLTENDIVITDNGAIIDPKIWQSLAYNGRYAFRQDKISANKFLIFRFSEAYYSSIVSKDPKPKESGFFKTGQDFDINEVDINGNKLRSKDLKGKVLVLNYWFINCKPCRMEMPELNELVKEYKDSANVKFIGISLDDRSAIREFIKLSPFNYQLVADGQTAAHRYGISAYPTHAIIDGEGKVYFHTVSSPRQLFYWMRKTINELLEKQNQKPNI